jgi:hypothetical protein
MQSSLHCSLQNIFCRQHVYVLFGTRHAHFDLMVYNAKMHSIAESGGRPYSSPKTSPAPALLALMPGGQGMVSARPPFRASRSKWQRGSGQAKCHQGVKTIHHIYVHFFPTGCGSQAPIGRQYMPGYSLFI